MSEADDTVAEWVRIMVDRFGWDGTQAEAFVTAHELGPDGRESLRALLEQLVAEDEAGHQLGE